MLPISVLKCGSASFLLPFPLSLSRRFKARSVSIMVHSFYTKFKGDRVHIVHFEISLWQPSIANRRIEHVFLIPIFFAHHDSWFPVHFSHIFPCRFFRCQDRVKLNTSETSASSASLLAIS